MSEDIIRKNNSAYAKYEELLLRRDELKKEAFQMEQAYIREFGDLILEVFRKKLECIRKKKTIEYCRTFINHGENVDLNAQFFCIDTPAAISKRIQKTPPAT